MLTVDSRNT